MIKRIITTPELLDLVNGESKPCVEVGLKDGSVTTTDYVDGYRHGKSMRIDKDGDVSLEYYYYNSLIY